VKTGYAHAKINLYLRVVGLRPDGYHELEMVNCCLDLADLVTVEAADDLSLRVQGTLPAKMLAAIPAGCRNLAAKAALKLCEARGLPAHFRITLEKRIPVGAGLGGGSADAACALRLIGGPAAALAAVAPRLGADVPYCLDGRPALVTGIGEIVRPVPMPRALDFVLVNPGIPLATPMVFGAYDREDAGRRRPRPVKPLLDALAAGNVRAVAAAVYNDLEPVAIRQCPEIERIQEELNKAGALVAFMTGSGSTVLGLFEQEALARAAAERLAGLAPLVRACRSIPAPGGA